MTVVNGTALLNNATTAMAKRHDDGVAASIAQKGDRHHDCRTKAQEFEAATKSHAEEFKALAQENK